MMGGIRLDRVDFVDNLLGDTFAIDDIMVLPFSGGLGNIKILDSMAVRGKDRVDCDTDIRIIRSSFSDTAFDWLTCGVSDEGIFMYCNGMYSIYRGIVDEYVYYGLDCNYHPEIWCHGRLVEGIKCELKSVLDMSLFDFAKKNVGYIEIPCIGDVDGYIFFGTDGSENRVEYKRRFKLYKLGLKSLCRLRGGWVRSLYNNYKGYDGERGISFVSDKLIFFQGNDTFHIWYNETYYSGKGLDVTPIIHDDSLSVFGGIKDVSATQGCSWGSIVRRLL